MKNFWTTVPKPLYILAPMEGVTDSVFRQIIAECGAPDVFFTEFTNCEGLLSSGKKHVEQRLQFTKRERPIVGQIWGIKPQAFYESAKIISEMGFDGIDINMGCPDRTIVRKGSCGALIKNPTLAREIIQATKEGSEGLPISVKTRIGFTQLVTEEWVQFLLEQKIDALTLHLRTVKEESKVPAHWDEIEKAVDIRNKLKLKTLIIGNGDVKSIEEAEKNVKRYGIDGVMMGRGIFQNMWLFNKDVNPGSITSKQRFELLVKHVELYEKTWGNTKNFAPMRKFVKAYINDFPNAGELREQLMLTATPEELISIVNPLLG